MTARTGLLRVDQESLTHEHKTPVRVVQHQHRHRQDCGFMLVPDARQLRNRRPDLSRHLTCATCREPALVRRRLLKIVQIQ